MTALNDPRLVPLLEKADRCYAAATSLLSSSSLTHDDLTITKASLLATIVDGLGAVLALLRSHGQAHAETINRSLIEALGDLHHLCADPGFLDSLRLTSALKQKSAAERYIANRNGDSDATLQIALAKQNAQAAKALIAKLRQQKVAPVGPNQRVGAPDLPEEVQGVYALNSFDAHNDLTALRRRHYREDHLVFGDTLLITNALSVLHGALLTVAFAIVKAPEFLNVNAGSVVTLFQLFHTTIDEVNFAFAKHSADDRARLNKELGVEPRTDPK